MKQLFTVHAGEYIVGSYIEQHLKGYEVWVPSRDTGVDLLVTNRRSGAMVGLQVKFSKDFLVTNMSPAFHKDLLSCGWWTLHRDKIKNSKADFWVFVLYGFDHRAIEYVILKPKKLLSILTSIHGKEKIIQSYLWVTKKKRCWETRGLKKSDQHLLAGNMYTNSQRELTEYLDDWKSVKKALLRKS